jgi:Membrane-associated lipoprotein involved in thiamine biosynthesis
MKNGITILAFAGSMLFSCGQSAPYFKHVGFTQGTYYSITYDSPKGINYENEIAQLLYDFSASLSTYDPTSLISRINKNDTTAIIDDFFRTVFNKAAEVNLASDGLFDITISPIINLWGFGFTGDKPDLDSKRIDSLLQYVGMNKIHIEGNKVVKDLPGVMLDVNAIAKGYSVDVIADFLKSKGCRNYLVDIGGECVARGVNALSDTWLIGIERPVDGSQYGSDIQSYLRLNNSALATSGNNRRFFVIDGVKYAHTFDVKTGYPVMHNLLSATIVANDCITADAWATVCMAAGLEKSIVILQQHPELEGLLVYCDENGDYNVYATKGMNIILVK